MKRFFALLLCLALLIAALPVTALADANPVPEAIQAVVTIISGIGYSNGSPYALNGKTYSSGTGFGVGEAGKDAQIFATNCHVVSEIKGKTMHPYDTVYIFVDDSDIFNESSVVRCEVLYADPEVDLAIIQAEAPIPGVTTLPLRAAEDIPVGEPVFAMGYPSIADQLADSNRYTTGDITVTDGVVSRHLVSDGVNCMAHTASVNHGNSGGPLINGQGQVIGINTFIYTDIENADKRNYAIYADYVMETLEELGLPYREDDSGSVSPAVLVGIGLAVLLLLAAAVIWLRRRKPKGPVITVTALNGPLAGRSWQLKSTLSIGRDPGQDIVLPPDTKGVSRSHCVIGRQGSGVFVVDKNSSYGTFLNGQRLPPEQPVQLSGNATLSLASDRVQFLIRFA